MDALKEAWQIVRESPSADTLVRKVALALDKARGEQTPYPAALMAEVRERIEALIVAIDYTNRSVGYTHRLKRRVSRDDQSMAMEYDSMVHDAVEEARSLLARLPEK